MFLLPTGSYQIKRTKKKGRGVFTRQAIPAGTIIGDYLGRVVSDAEAEVLEERYGQGCYSFEYIGRNVCIFPLDLHAADVHLINHSCAGNIGNADYQGHNLFFALRHIFPGEELTFDYQFDPESDGAVSYCFCDSPFCRGTMYKRFKKPLLRKKKAAKVTQKTKKNFTISKVGEILPPLKHYPRNIADNPEKYSIFANLQVPPLLISGRELPPLKEIRRQLRLSGRRLKFKDLGLSVLAVFEDHLITER